MSRSYAHRRRNGCGICAHLERIMLAVDDLGCRELLD
jgi:hypothetical protein